MNGVLEILKYFNSIDLEYASQHKEEVNKKLDELHFLLGGTRFESAKKYNDFMNSMGISQFIILLLLQRYRKPTRKNWDNTIHTVWKCRLCGSVATFWDEQHPEAFDCHFGHSRSQHGVTLKTGTLREIQTL